MYVCISAVLTINNIRRRVCRKQNTIQNIQILAYRKRPCGDDITLPSHPYARNLISPFRATDIRTQHIPYMLHTHAVRVYTRYGASAALWLDGSRCITLQNCHAATHRVGVVVVVVVSYRRLRRVI